MSSCVPQTITGITGVLVPAALTEEHRLPSLSCCTKHGIRTEYSSAAETGVEVVGQETFCVLENALPAKCEDLRDKMKHTSSDFQNLNISPDLQSHVELAKLEWGFHITYIDIAKKILKNPQLHMSHSGA